MKELKEKVKALRKKNEGTTGKTLYRDWN